MESNRVGPATVKAPPRQRAPRKRCEEGCDCLPCQNVRWDRIFQEKFADATYYTRNREMRRDSTLNWSSGRGTRR